jgi:hypothetical protein
MRYSQSIGHNPVLLGVLASLDYQASFCLFVDCAEVFYASDNTRIEDISVRRYCVDVHKRKCSAINQSADLLVDGIDPHLWIHCIVGLGCFGSKYMMYNSKAGSGYSWSCC